MKLTEKDSLALTVYLIHFNIMIRKQSKLHVQLTSGASTVAMVGLKVAALTNRLKMILVAPDSVFSKSSVIWHT